MTRRTRTMAIARMTRSISVPIILASGAVALCLALLAGWSYLVLQNPELVADLRGNRWLLAAGIGSLVVIMFVIVLFTVFLVREIREVRRQTSFIDSVTHELKSPLAALKLCLETLARPDLPGPQHERLRRMMHDDVERLTAFIDRVLTATRLAGEVRPAQHLTDISLAELARRCAGGVTRRAHLADDVVRVDIAPELRIVTDEVALAAVLENLIDNAIKYSGDDVEVIVSASPVEARGQVALEVRDRGIGIPRTHLRRVFERFYRVPDEAVRERRGTGLGLYVVSALVRSLGGRAEALSPGPGQGTTLRVTLPMRLRSA
ncbi:sensor histidine kinase [Nannocystis punicea]|uniref:histidine kinase n=1 Tax=Nannocystis punicea TaxID=2995304 RepID=A0ABY7H4B5_9BACT|nr:HAMP domain-containing sensor histidine kinase [Nannocystis poenicansa]WAS93859.1 HAMP domain-containing sensor histidine kinase [Nannocystis poenicansa]